VSSGEEVEHTVWHETIARLAEYSDTKEFERLCVDLLVRSGFADIIPRGPGSQDGSADATRAYFPEEQAFQFSIQRTWRRKLLETVTHLAQPKARALRVGGSLVFVTSQPVPPVERDRLVAQVWSRYRIRVTVLDREWLRLQLDVNQDIRSTYLGIPPNRGYRPGGHRGPPGEFAAHFALPDFVRHLFILAVMRRSPYLGFLRAYYRDRIAPFIQDPSCNSSELLPLDRSEAAAKCRITVMDGNTTKTFLPAVEQLPEVRGLVKFYGMAAATPHHKISIPVRGGVVVLPDTRLTGVTAGVQFVSIYCGTQFRRLQVEAHDRLQVDYERADRIIYRVMRQLRRLLGKSWADAFAERPSSEALGLLLEWSWSDRALELTVPFFLSSVGCRSLRRILKHADDATLRRVAMLLADDRIPLRFRGVAYDAARQRMLEPEVIEHLAYYSEHRPSEWDRRRPNWDKMMGRKKTGGT
jgi:hypothetical protein